MLPVVEMRMTIARGMNKKEASSFYESLSVEKTGLDMLTPLPIASLLLARHIRVHKHRNGIRCWPTGL